MKKLHECEACGFLSTQASEFTVHEGHNFDVACWGDYLDARKPACFWVLQVLSLVNSQHPEEEPSSSAI